MLVAEYVDAQEGDGMVFKFSKGKFLKKAPVGIRQQLKGQEGILDGAEVIFDGRLGRDGYIPRCIAGGQEYWLYPVYRSWCDVSGACREAEEVKGNG